jgi:hypothetical protein
MARPIKETPILKGKDASNFLQSMKQSEATRVSSQERANIKEAFNTIKNIAKH